RSMRQVKRAAADDDMRPEYDSTNAIRGKYYARYMASSNVVVLDPDVSEVFPNAASVNEALRLLVSVAHRRASTRRHPERAPNNRGQRKAPVKLKRRR